MANDIIGAPEIFVIKGRVFKFSPLNDYEMACLEAWLRWRTNSPLNLLAQESLQELATIAGAAQLLYYSIKRTEVDVSIVTLAEFLSGDEDAALAVFEAWAKLNIHDLKLPELKQPEETSGKQSGKEGSIDDVYTLLSRYYKWTPQQISQLTKYQQAAYLQAIVGGNSSANDGLFFDTEEEYQLYLANKRSVG